MSSDMVWLLPVLAGASAFGTIIFIWAIIVLIFFKRRSNKEKSLHERLGLRANDSEKETHVLRLWRDGQTITTVVPDGPKKQSKLEQIRHEMGWRIPGYLIIIGLLCAGILGFTVMFLFTGDILLAFGLGLLLIMGPWMFLTNIVTKRQQMFDAQLADALSLASRSLKAGHPLPAAFQLIVQEMCSPIKEVFQEIIQQQNLGMSLEEAIRVSSDNHGSPDLKLFAASVVIQVRSGGNLADTMHRLSEVIRDRMRLARRARSLTAQVQLSKRVLIAVPFLTAVMIQFISPDYLKPLYTTPTGRILCVVAVVLLVVGMQVMNKMAELKY